MRHKNRNKIKESLHDFNREMNLISKTNFRNAYENSCSLSKGDRKQNEEIEWKRSASFFHLAFSAIISAKRIMKGLSNKLCCRDMDWCAQTQNFRRHRMQSYSYVIESDFSNSNSMKHQFENPLRQVDVLHLKWQKSKIKCYKVFLPTHQW